MRLGHVNVASSMVSRRLVSMECVRSARKELSAVLTSARTEHLVEKVGVFADMTVVIC